MSQLTPAQTVLKGREQVEDCVRDLTTAHRSVIRLLKLKKEMQLDDKVVILLLQHKALISEYLFTGHSFLKMRLDETWDKLTEDLVITLNMERVAVAEFLEEIMTDERVEHATQAVKRKKVFQAKVIGAVLGLAIAGILYLNGFFS